MTTRRIHPEEFKATAWSGGVTREIFIDPPDAQYGRHDFNCRVSTAIVESRESVFTDLPHVQRFIMPLNGELILSVDGVRHHIQPFEVFAFDGGAKVTSLSRANLQDLNLMVRKDLAGEVQVIPPGHSIRLDPDQRQLVVLIRLNAAGQFQEIREVLVKPYGDDGDPLGLGADELAVLMTLPVVD